MRSARPIQARGFAAAASGPSFETYDAAGVKVASRDGHGETSKLAVVVKAGTRYQPLPGLTVGLEEFAFKNTSKRSALRITRETELLGGQLNAYHTREALVLEAGFLREDLPYFAELLAEVLTQTRYTTHEFHEDVERAIHLKQAKLAANPAAVSQDAAHTVAFHSGLGSPMYPSSATSTKGYLDEYSIAAFAEQVYTKPNIALVGDGASQGALSQWASKFFNEVPASSQQAVQSAATTYYGGEQRIEGSTGNAITIAFPTAASSPEASVLAALLGGQSTVKWSPGFSLLAKIAASSGANAVSSNLVYSDAGLLTITLSGSAASVRQAAQEAVKALESIAAGSVSNEDITKAIAKAKFDVLDQTQSSKESILSVGSALVNGAQPTQPATLVQSYASVTPAKVQAVAKSLLEGKATVATVGDLHALPYAQDLGLKV
ncbi:Cytochrome b-c1 complex subunit 2, mitochondrial [Scedosporium apiospermum]|uniref:Cytochrome b-c1 complex subunit 2, mitochondrial n=1 Tax=Pseudallescheria apiosperma TaxID=563466 RepID=A0A084GBS7_PSEDA|nr:Cytochrome b-c1 complex subunit 2, mitochondrial [Scedosporium apiospermum]KEZ44789.1 Cytochrome b-c1 complex subunit 2, mitochondrial [Scedosporium apiospermum]